MNKLIAITNARLVGGQGTLVLDGDRIAAIGGDVPAGAEILDAKGAHVAPGIVDLGVFSVDKRACIAGGITRIALMPEGRDSETLRARSRWLAHICSENGFSLSDRLHIHLYGDTRGT